ncbi:MAG TPA: RNA polymerase sigma factor [Longimicrobium sp.]|nr:RNA polymerase sigma factor [Longimicrobium sp.]
MVARPEELEAEVARARGGDEGAFGRLANAVRAQVHRWALVRTGDADEAEDVAQRVLIKLHRGLHAFEGRSRFTTWLYRLTANAAVEHGRARTRRLEVHRGAAEPAPLTPGLEERIARLESERTAALVRGFFGDLPPRQRELVDLVDVQGYTAAEAAEMLDLEPATARVHLFRGRRALRERMLAAHPHLFGE